MVHYPNLSIEGGCPLGSRMGEDVKWGLHTIIGAVLVGQTFFSWGAPAGPWDAPSFTIGVIGLVGLGFLWVAKHRFIFQRGGIIPYLDGYRIEMERIPLLALADAGIGLLLFFLLGAIPDGGIVETPDPAPLIMLLYVCLMGLHALYAWLVISGPLRDE